MGKILAEESSNNFITLQYSADFGRSGLPFRLRNGRMREYLYVRYTIETGDVSMKTAYRSFTSLILLCMASSAFAHEGHGNPQWIHSVLHYIFEPEHLSVILPGVLAVLLILRWVRHRVFQSRASLSQETHSK